MLPLAALALPALAPEVPAQYVLPGEEALVVPLTIALLEAGVISDAMLRTPRNALLVDVFGAQERQLAERALAHWWTNLIRVTPCKFFRWKLHIQQLDETGHGYDKATTAWFCFTRLGDEVPRFELAGGIEKLELLLEGFGQTVLAVLRDATKLLPDSFTPWYALGWAYSAYWRDCKDDAEMLEMMRQEGGYKTVEEVYENEHVITRAVFFADMPEWVCAPKRTVARDAMGAAASTELARRVIDLCDALSALVNQPTFVLRPEHKGVYRCGQDSVDASMILVWKRFDVIGDAIDDALEHIGQCGEYCEFIDANPVPMTAAGVREFMAHTEQAIQVAVLVEQLVLLLGEKF